MVNLVAQRTLPQSRLSVRLLSGFALVNDGSRLDLPRTEAKLIAFLALQRRPVARDKVAGVLWGDRSEQKAQACLRSALWRIRKSADGFLDEGDSLGLADWVSIDLDEITGRAQQMLLREAPFEERRLTVPDLTAELLPDWYDDWVHYERERHRQLSLHALEALALELADHGHFAAAVDAAMAAIEMEPLRESAHRAVIKVHLAEGNVTEATRHFRMYERTLESEMGITPSPRLQELVGPLPWSVPGTQATDPGDRRPFVRVERPVRS